jgi:hypothetical protein
MPIKPPRNLVQSKSKFDWLIQSFLSLNKSHLIQAGGIFLIMALGAVILRSEILLRFEYLFLDLDQDIS